MMKKKWLLIIVLIAIVSIAFYFRYQLAWNSGVWQDETTVYSLASFYSSKDLFFINHWDKAHPPLLYIFLRGILILNSLQPISIQVIRMIFVVFSSLAVIPIFFVSRKWLENNYSALFVALWYALSPFQIQAGYGVRPYAVLQFFFPIVLFTFDNSQFKSKKNIIFWNILFIFLFYWDYASIWFFLCFFLYQVILKHKNFFKTLLFLVKTFWLFFLSVAIRIPLFIRFFSEALNLESYLKPNFLVDLYEMIFLHFQETNILEKIEPITFGFISIAFVLVFTQKNKQEIKKIFILLFFSLLPPLIAFIYGFFNSPILMPRNQLFSSLCLLLLLGMSTKSKFIGICFGIITSIVFFMVITANSSFLPYSDLEIIITDQTIAQMKSQNRSEITVMIVDKSDDLFYALLYALFQKGFRPIVRKPNAPYLFKYLGQEKGINMLTMNENGYISTTDTQIAYFLTAPGEYPVEMKKFITNYCPINQDTFTIIELSSNYLLIPCSYDK